MTEDKKLDLVLLVDDDPVVNILNTVIIKQSGFVKEIRQADSAESALNALTLLQLEKKWPSIIFVDINMPGIDGWEFIEMLGEKFIDFKNKCVICVLSSSLDPRDRDKATQSPWVDSFLSKPLPGEAMEHLCRMYYDLKVGVK